MSDPRSVVSPTLVEKLEGFAAELASNAGSAITAYSGDAPLVRAAAARIRELAARLHAAEAYIDADDRGDDSFPQYERWLALHTESEDRNG